MENSEQQEFEEIEGADFSEAARLIEQADREQSESKADQMQDEPGPDMADPERSARSLVRGGMQVLNWLLRFKEPRIQYDQNVIEEAEASIAPALVKHGVGSGGVTRFGEEIAAGGFLLMLGINTKQAITELKAADEAKAKAAKEAAGGGDQSQQ